MSDRQTADPDLVGAIRSGDLRAFEAFYRAYETPVHRTALALTRDAMVAEEVVVDTFLRAYAARERLDPERSALPWLQRIAVNLSLNHLRRRRLRFEPIESVEAFFFSPRTDDDLSPERISERRETAEMVVEGVARLPDRLRSVVVLRYLHEYSLAEIAEILDCPLGTVKSRHHDALRALRRQLRGILAPTGADAASGAGSIAGTRAIAATIGGSGAIVGTITATGAIAGTITGSGATSGPRPPAGPPGEPPVPRRRSIP